MTREFSMRKCLIASVLLGVMSFGITLAPFATTWPGTWPSCAGNCQQFEPGKNNQDISSCNTCCYSFDGCGGANDTRPNDTAACIACCNSYNYGNPNGNTHCQGSGPIPTLLTPVGPYVPTP